jgi:hypothetical protein
MSLEQDRGQEIEHPNSETDSSIRLEIIPFKAFRPLLETTIGNTLITEVTVMKMALDLLARNTDQCMQSTAEQQALYLGILKNLIETHIISIQKVQEALLWDPDKPLPIDYECKNEPIISLKNLKKELPAPQAA